MLRTEDIRSLSDFRQNATAHLDRLAETGTAEVLTVNGQAKGVVMAPKTFDDMLKRIAWLDHLEKLDRGMTEAQAGKDKDARQALRDIAAELGLDLKR